MKKLFTPSATAKIGAGFIALATMFGFSGCTNPAGSDNEVIDPNVINALGNINVRFAEGAVLTAEQRDDIVTSLQGAGGWTRFLWDAGVRNIEITGMGTGTSFGQVGATVTPQGAASGTFPTDFNAGTFLEAIFNEASNVIAYDMANNTIFLANGMGGRGARG